jgi:hypothetical protein
MNARELLFRSPRFDLAFKYLYALNRERPEREFALYREMYLESIRIFNGFREISPPKSSPLDFLTSFDALIEQIRRDGFDQRFAIPLDRMMNPLDGAHRIAIAAALDIEVPVCVKMDTIKALDDDYRHFYKRKLKGNVRLLDQAALEFSEANPFMRAVCISRKCPVGIYRRVHEALIRQGNIYLKRCGVNEEFWLFVPSLQDFALPNVGSGVSVRGTHRETMDAASEFFSAVPKKETFCNRFRRKYMNPYMGV